MSLISSFVFNRRKTLKTLSTLSVVATLALTKISGGIKQIKTIERSKIFHPEPKYSFIFLLAIYLTIISRIKIIKAINWKDWINVFVK